MSTGKWRILLSPWELKGGTFERETIAARQGGRYCISALSALTDSFCCKCIFDASYEIFERLSSRFVSSNKQHFCQKCANPEQTGSALPAMFQGKCKNDVFLENLQKHATDLKSRGIFAQAESMGRVSGMHLQTIKSQETLKCSHFPLVWTMWGRFTKRIREMRFLVTPATLLGTNWPHKKFVSQIWILHLPHQVAKSTPCFMPPKLKNAPNSFWGNLNSHQIFRMGPYRKKGKEDE